MYRGSKSTNAATTTQRRSSFSCFRRTDFARGCLISWSRREAAPEDRRKPSQGKQCPQQAAKFSSCRVSVKKGERTSQTGTTNGNIYMYIYMYFISKTQGERPICCPYGCEATFISFKCQARAAIRPPSVSVHPPTPSTRPHLHSYHTPPPPPHTQRRAHDTTHSDTHATTPCFFLLPY